MQKLNYNRVITHTPGTGHVCISDYFKHLWQKLTGMTNANKKLLIGPGDQMAKLFLQYLAI